MITETNVTAPVCVLTLYPAESMNKTLPYDPVCALSLSCPCSVQAKIQLTDFFTETHCPLLSNIQPAQADSGANIIKRDIDVTSNVDLIFLRYFWLNLVSFTTAAEEIF